jgi:DNA polymerase-3 subunit gamma/tau
MTYLALARQWRPRSFDALLGQDMVNLALTNALTQQRLHHAYLFTGTRGVGKTSVARLFAKALNCVQGISSTPCLTCDNCTSIEKGCFVDLLEIDGASKTRVEDTRDLLENVQYAPSCGRFKIYLIDEVHMLSQHSFNALLKTLEEPPAHVKFLFATTDPQKLPATILSRCLQFHLRPLSETLIQSHLQTIVAHEQLEAETQALALIAQAASGSMRDALSLLEQVMACSTGKMNASTVKSLLGYTQEEYATSILQALEARDAASLFAMSEQIAQEGGHYPYVLERLLHEVYQSAKLKHLPAQSAMRPIQPMLEKLIATIEPETLQLWYQIVLKGLSDLKIAPNARIGFEMCLLRLLAFQPAAMSTEVEASGLCQKASPPREAPAPIEREEPSLQSPQTESMEVSPPSLGTDASQERQAPPPDALEATPVLSSTAAQDINWETLIKNLKLSGMALIAAEQAELESRTEHTLTLKITSSHQSLFTPNVMKQLEAALSAYFQKPMKVKLSTITGATTSPAQMKKQQQTEAHAAAEQALQTDPVFQTLQNEFEAEVVIDSVYQT